MYRLLICASLLILSSVGQAQGPGSPPPFAYPEQFESSRQIPSDYRWAQNQPPQPPIGSGYRVPTNGSIPLTGPREVIVERPSPYSIEYWYKPSEWSSSFELGLNGSQGNAETFSLRTGADLKRTAGNYTMTFELDYARTNANAVETQHNSLLQVDQKWSFGESPWSAFFNTGLEYDEFKAFDLRLILNGGLGYTFFKTDASKLAGRIGSGVSREFGGPDNRWTPEAVFGMDFSHRMTKRQKFNFKADYFPEWGEFTDYRLRSEANWELLLDDEANLSLKFGIIDRYDSTPQGRKPNDIDYTAVILWKL